MSVDYRARFAEQFGEENAALVEDAAIGHKAERSFDHARGYGSDRFRWDVLTVISFQCIEKYAKSHGFTCEWDDVKSWLQQPEQRVWLAEHDGDVDAIAVFCGAYSDFMPEEVEA